MNTERKELIALLRMDYTASPMALTLMQQAADMLEAADLTAHVAYSSGFVEGERAAIVAQATGQRPRLTEREIGLLNGMIDVHLQHAERCDAIQNRRLAEMQKGWDMERVALLRKVLGES